MMHEDGHGARDARHPMALALLATLLLAAPYLWAFPAAATGPGAETISGVVYDEHGTPKAGVVVWCAPSNAAVTTDADGRYDLSGTGLDGQCRLIYSADGYLTSVFNCTLADGGSRVENVYMVESSGASTGSVEGVVRSSEGDPLAGARLVLAGGDGWSASTETGSDGGFGFHDVPASDIGYALTADAKGFDAASVQAHVAVGAVSRVELVLGLEGHAEVVKGRVSDSGGLPLPGALVSIEGIRGTWATDLGGIYRVQMEGIEGARSVTASLRGYLDATAEVSVAPNGVAWANLTLPGAGLAGPETVWVAVSEASTGGPVEGATVTVAGHQGTWTTDARGLAVVIAEDLEGPRTVLAREDGCTQSSADVTLEDGGTASVPITLVQASNAVVLTGDAMDASTGTPVWGARVGVNASGIERTTVTGASGTFRIVDLPPDVEASVTVTAEGYQAVTSRMVLREYVPNVAHFALEPALRLTIDVQGKVYDESTHGPVVGAQVTLWGAIAHRVLRTDASGRFSLDAVPVSGDTLYYLVEDQFHSASSGLVGIGGGPVAAIVDVPLTPIAPPQTVVAGWARDADGLPVGGARVSLAFAQRTWETVSDDGGSYELFLSMGTDFTGDLSATADGYGWHNQTPMLRVHEVNWINFTVPLGPQFGNVLGRVSVKGSLRPIEGAEVFLARGGAFHERTATAADGTFAFQRVPAAEGPYELAVVAEGYSGATVDAYLLAGGTVFHNLTVREDVPTTEAVVGSVLSRSGMPLPGAVVEVAGFEPIVTDAEGAYLISSPDLEGARVLVATAPGFSPVSVRLDIAPGETVRTNLTLAAAPSDLAIVTGTVASSSDGRPIDGAVVKLAWSDAGVVAFEARTGRNGSFTFLGVPASLGDVTIIASAAGYHTDSAVLDVGPGLVTQTTFALKSAQPAVKGGKVLTTREKVVVGASAGVVAATLGALVATEVGRVAIMGLLLVPLYTKIRREKVMDHFVRGRIYEYICQNPGVNYSAIKQRFSLTNGTVTYHLSMLERQEFIRPHQDGIYKRYFKSGMGPSMMDESPMSLQRSILRLVNERPGLTQKDLARELGTSKQLVSYYIRNMRDEGLVETHRSGRSVKVYPGNPRPQ